MGPSRSSPQNALLTSLFRAKLIPRDTALQYIFYLFFDPNHPKDRAQGTKRVVFKYAKRILHTYTYNEIAYLKPPPEAQSAIKSYGADAIACKLAEYSKLDVQLQETEAPLGVLHLVEGIPQVFVREGVYSAYFNQYWRLEKGQETRELDEACCATGFMLITCLR